MPVQPGLLSPSSAVRESWRAYLAAEGGEHMPLIEQLHAAHVAGFVGALMYAGMPEHVARSIAEVEFRRRDREGDPA